MIVRVEEYNKPLTYSIINFQRLKQSLFMDIQIFCRGFTDIRQSMHGLRIGIGQERTPYELEDYVSALKRKYNNADTNVGIDGRIELTRFDISLAVTVIIKRTDITMRTFIFRYKKKGGAAGELAYPEYSPIENSGDKT